VILNLACIATGIAVGVAWQSARIRRAQRDRAAWLRSLAAMTKTRGEW
jgi:hypothetical protein